jgi:glycosyltransferase involved in cell wall biosynthesis
MVATMSAYAKRVSVIMPVLNGAGTIKHALASVLSELSEEDELIVVDDKSIDGTRNVVEGFGERVNLISNSGTGIVDALNTGLRRARGMYIARCDADDSWVSGRLSALIDGLEFNPNAAACFGAAVIVDTQGNHRGVRVPPIDPESVRTSLLRRNVLTHGAVLARHFEIDRAGGYRDMPGAEDYDLWLRLTRNAPIVTIARPVYIYNSSDKTSQSLRRRVAARSSLRILLSHARATGEYSLRGLIRNALSAAWPARRFWNPG